jgi:hypothetical protein
MLQKITDNFDWVELAKDVSMAADFATIPHRSETFDLGSMQAIWTGGNSKTGTIIPEASIDGINWCALVPDVAQKKTNPAAAGCCMYEFPTIGYPYIRARFVSNSVTTGTITIISFLKRRRANNP